MAGNILTPLAIWKDFKIEGVPQAKLIKEENVDGVIFTHYYLQGRAVGEENVEIYGVLAKRSQRAVAPAVLLVQDLEQLPDRELTIDLVKRGYTVFSVDIAGKAEGKENYTVYPSQIDYANYQNVKDTLYVVEGEVVKTCWYEWTCVLKYALKYLKSLSKVSRVGAIGVKESATALWQVAGMDFDGDLACSIFALNAGWNGYRGINKFGGMVEPQFSDNMYKFIAGVEPQAYAMHVKCPTLVLSATNSPLYDCDRAYDTISRIETGYTVIQYSVGYSDRISNQAYLCALTFLEVFLKKDGAKADALPYETDISCEIKDGKIVVSVTPFAKNIAEVELFVAEEVNNPSLRCFTKVIGGEKTKDGVYEFSYLPYPESGSVTMFAQVNFKGDMAVGSKIINKKFSPEEITHAHKSNLLYSSREKNAESVFYSANQDGKDHLFLKKEDDAVIVKKGPMGIEGVYSKDGLLSFKFGTKKDRPANDAMFMCDVYSKTAGEMWVKLIADYFGDKTEYVYKVNLSGGDVWQNVKAEISKFKTAEGRTLKTLEKIQAVELGTDSGEYLINNALWV
ncbi:MAG: hypothetical protein J6U92_04585 [Clostridia bacterium]|nr:hypothetical protein [Clostridia bacterium]